MSCIQWPDSVWQTDKVHGLINRGGKIDRRRDVYRLIYRSNQFSIHGSPEKFRCYYIWCSLTIYQWQFTAEALEVKRLYV